MLAKLLSYADRRLALARMAAALLLSGSQVHAALNRLEAARLVFKDSRSSRPHTSNRRVPARLVFKDGRSSRPNTSAAEEFLVHGAKYIFPAVPLAAQADSRLYELLALVDALRDGRARERSLAEREIVRRIRERTNA